MSKSKKAALLEIDLDVHYYGVTARNRVGDILDEYAKSQVISYEIWLDAELNNDSSFNYNKTPEQLYDLFIQHQSQQP